MMLRRYPIGIQTFSEMIRERYVYVDKTDLIWQRSHGACPPVRFLSKKDNLFWIIVCKLRKKLLSLHP